MYGRRPGGSVWPRARASLLAVVGLLLLLGLTTAVNPSRPVRPLATSGSRNKSFDVVWSGLWPCCDGKTGFNLSAFPVLQQHRLAWFGPGLGLFNETVAPVGLPQTVDLAAHAAKVAADVAAIVPEGNDDMYCCIDWEEYVPVFYDHATVAHPAGGPGSGGCPGFYTAPDGNSRYDMPGAGCAAANAALNASVALVQRTTPGAAGMNASALASLAVKEFNAAARTFWLKTLAVFKTTRPGCKVGFYGKPETEDIKPPFVDSYDRAVGDAYQWLFDEQTALFPSTYMHFNTSGDETSRLYGLAQPQYNTEYVEAIVTEAQRVNGNRPKNLGRVPVLPWVWYRYICASHHPPSVPLPLFPQRAIPLLVLPGLVWSGLI
jgi:hypothetical protein